MARRNKATRVQRNPTGATGANPSRRRTKEEIAEDAAERKKFFVWTGIITAIVVLAIYYLLFS